MMNPQTRRGFTFIEVILILLIVVIGLLGVIGLASYGSSLASKAQGNALGMATAVSVANDQSPLLDPAVSGDWTVESSIDLDAKGTTTGKAKGYINGFYVEREETSVWGEPGVPWSDANKYRYDIVAMSGNTVLARRSTVQVTVYQASGGRRIATFATQILRQRGVAP